ncbi:MAG: ribonuclease III [Acidobacteriota bacterium]
MIGNLANLEATMGHTFQDRLLLERALTHKSRAHELPGEVSASSNNEQLEFLGDAILGFIISDYLVRRFPHEGEGRLSKLKAHLVSAAHLHASAQELGLGEFLLLGKGEEMSGGRAKKTLLADAMEALIAAMYLDGGIGPTRGFVEMRIAAVFHELETENGGSVPDYKSTLQELAQTLKMPPPKYITISEDGPEHSKTFTVEVRVGKDWSSQAQGPSKKTAGQKAAQQILEVISA